MLDTHQLQQITWAIEAGIKEGLNEQPTLRDRFAMAAMQGLLASESEGDSFGIFDEDVVKTHNRFERIAKFAYAHADAMLEARKPQEPVK